MLEENELHLECLKLALGRANRATSPEYIESAKRVTERAQAYLDFVTAKPKPVGSIRGASYEFGPGVLMGQGKPESAAPDDDIDTLRK
jgi:hypothetical protein